MKRANGEGSIYKRKDGRWCASYYDESENSKRHTIYGKTQAEVRRKLKERQLNPEEDLIEYSCAVTPQVRQTGNRLSGLAGTAYASLLT